MPPDTILKKLDISLWLKYHNAGCNSLEPVTIHFDDGTETKFAFGDSDSCDQDPLRHITQTG